MFSYPSRLGPRRGRRRRYSQESKPRRRGEVASGSPTSPGSPASPILACWGGSPVLACWGRKTKAPPAGCLLPAGFPLFGHDPFFQSDILDSGCAQDSYEIAQFCPISTNLYIRGWAPWTALSATVGPGISPSRRPEQQAAETGAQPGGSAGGGVSPGRRDRFPSETVRDVRDRARQCDYRPPLQPPQRPFRRLLGGAARRSLTFVLRTLGKKARGDSGASPSAARLQCSYVLSPYRRA